MQNNISGPSGTPNTQLSNTSSHTAVSDQAEKKPRMQSKKTAEIIIDADGRRFRNGVELFYESESDSDTEQDTPKQPKEKSDGAITAPSQSKAAIVTESVESRCNRLRSAIKAGDIDTVKQLVTQYPDLVRQADQSDAPLLHQAINDGQSAMAELLVHGGVSLNYQDASGTTALMLAIRLKHVALAEALIREGASVSQANKKGATPLMIAAYLGDTQTMQLLLDCGADVNQTDHTQNTALFAAADSNQTKAVQLLISKGASVNHPDQFGWTPLHIAADRGNEEVTRLLIENHAAIDLTTRKGWTPLMCASKTGCLGIVRMLLEEKADIGKKSVKDVTAMMLAAENGHTEIAELLIRAGASVNQTDQEGRTPLIFAIEQGRYEVARLLLSFKASVDQADHRGSTPLMIAVEKGHTKLVRLLLDESAAIDRTDNQRRTPLTIACDKNRPEILKLLLGKLPNRAAIDARTPKGLTLLAHAARAGHEKIAEILLSHGTSINLPIVDGHTPLMIAAYNGNIAVLELLIDHGAAIDQEKQDGWTALMIACQSGQAEVVDLLLDKTRFSITQMAKMVSVAALKGHAKVLEHLFEKAKTSVTLSKALLKVWKSNPAEIAIKNGHPEALAVLLKNGIHPDPASETVWESLMKAADNGNTELLSLALDDFSSSLPLSSSSWLGRGPSPIYLRVQQSLIHAVQHDRQDIVRLLIRAGAKPDFLNQKAPTAVQVAIQQGNLPMLQLLLGPEVNLTKQHPNDRLSNELLLAISSDPPDPLIIDCLIDFDSEEKTKKAGFSYALDFQKLSDKVSDLLMAALNNKGNSSLQHTAITALLCGEFGLSYLAANTLAVAIRDIADIYARDLVTDMTRPQSNSLPQRGTPTTAQLRIAFAESIVSAQLLQDLMRYDERSPEQCYPHAARAPELAKKLARNTARQTGLLMVAAESVLSESHATLTRFLNMLSPTTTSQQIRGFMRSAGWHPMLAELVAECWDSIGETRTKAALVVAISQRLLTPEFAEILDHRTSDAARHYLQVQLNRLREIVQR